MNINLDKYFDAQKPAITIFSKTYEVDNDYKTVLSAQALMDSLSGNKEDVRKFLSRSLIGGNAAADEILAHDMPFPLLEKLLMAVMASMTGKSLEEIEQAAGEAQDGRFQGRTKKRV